MTSMQQKILGEIRDAVMGAASGGVEWVVQQEWANRGSIYIMRGLFTLARLEYDFQSTSASILVYDKVGILVGPEHGYLKYDSEESIAAMIERIVGLVS